MMRIANLKIEFTKFLEGEYPESEIHSFFTILSQFYLGMSRLDVAMNPHKMVSLEEEKLFLDAGEKLKSHHPIQYIIGQTEFFGYIFRVNDHVLIPRPETEELVQWILDDFKSKPSAEKLQMLDIGTGSGCIAVSLSKELSNSEVNAYDISAEALQTARENSEINSARVNFSKIDILETVAIDGKFDVIVSNPPYVREQEKSEMQRNVLEYEPAKALYVKDEDPLIFYSKITKLAKPALKKNGALYFEINRYLAEEIRILMENAGFQTELRKDIFGNYRMIKGILKEELL